MLHPLARNSECSRWRGGRAATLPGAIALGRYRCLGWSREEEASSEGALHLRQYVLSLALSDVCPTRNDDSRDPVRAVLMYRIRHNIPGAHVEMITDIKFWQTRIGLLTQSQWYTERVLSSYFEEKPCM